MKNSSKMNRKEFILSGSAAAAAMLLRGDAFAAETAMPQISATRGIRLKFLGTGAADWYKSRKTPSGGVEFRHWSSLLVENSVYIDFTTHNYDMIAPEGRPGHAPKVCFYTHSHYDHYEPKAAIEKGVERVYMHESWAEEAKKEFAEAAAKLGKSAPTVTAVRFGEWYEECGIKFMPLPANHATERPHELASIYLVEKGGARLLYAVDTGGIMGAATRFAGIDAHRKIKPITALVMEATIGLGYPAEYRIFNHSSVEQVKQTIDAFTATGAYKPPAGQSAYICHLTKMLYPCQEILERQLEKFDPRIKAAYDGLEVTLG